MEAETENNIAIKAIIGLMVLIVAVLLGVGAWMFLRSGEPSSGAFDPVFDNSADGPAVDSAARIEIERLRQQLEAMQTKIKDLETEISKLGARQFAAPQSGDPNAPFIQRDGPNQIIDAYAQVVLIANRRKVNQGLNVASPKYLEGKLGRPREVLSDRCETMTNEKLADMLVTEEVGPIRVRMLQPAVDSLKRVFAKVEATDPDLYARINTAGSLCVRQIRGTSGRTSTHSFGLSLDLNIDGHLDTLGDGRTQLGLTILADFFREEGWFWGASFSREDSMHFEVSREMVERWREEGKI